VPAPASAAGARVLVVDDEAGVRKVAGESLKRAGFEVVTANDGLDALERLAQDGAFHAVLLDVTMPRMGGVEAFRMMKAQQPELPIVLTSGYSAQEATTRFGNDGIAAFIQKPFMPAALVRTMLETVGRRRSGEVA
jgi:CheY-like chemotaxis protein